MTARSAVHRRAPALSSGGAAGKPPYTDVEGLGMARTITTIRGVVLGLAAMFWLAPTVVFAQTSKPNIVFILTDNLGYGEVGAYGGGIMRGAPTPRIDSLAREGMRFTNFNMDGHCS